jgi:hypothetical protein
VQLQLHVHLKKDTIYVERYLLFALLDGPAAEAAAVVVVEMPLAVTLYLQQQAFAVDVLVF